MARWNVDVPVSEYFGPLPANPRGIVSGDVGQLIKELEDTPKIAADSETTGLNYYKDHVLYWSLAWGRRRCTLHSSLLPLFTHIFNQPQKTWIGANFKFDMHMYAQMGQFFAGKCWDTKVQHCLLFEEESHSLKDMAKNLLGWRWSDFQDTFGKIRAGYSPLELIRKAEAEDFPLLVEYAANDAWGTLGVSDDLEKRLKAAQTHSLFREIPPYIETLWDLFEKVEAPYTKVLWKNERYGIGIDQQKIAEIEPKARREIEEMERELTRIVGWVMNPDSPAHLRYYFFDQMKMTPRRMTSGGKTGTRLPSTDSDFIDWAEQEGDPAARVLKSLRKLKKLHGTYIVGIPKFIDSNSRLHTTFNQDTARCMPAGELVLTNRGYLPVEQVVVGDRVITHTGTTKPVIETSQHRPQRIFRVQLSNGLVLRTTGHHQYKTVGAREWLRADQLQPGEPVVVHSSQEKWKTIKGWNQFEVSSWGRVRNIRTGHCLTQQLKNRWGHLKVCLHRHGAQSRGKDRKDFAVHRLVLRAFYGASTKETRHLNGIAWDNTLGNLIYGTSYENRQDALRHGTLSQRRAGRTILSEVDVEEIRKAGSPGQPPSTTSKLDYEKATRIRERFDGGRGDSRRQLANDYAVSYVAIDNIVKDRTWTKPPSVAKTAEELAIIYGVSPGTIRSIWAGRCWQDEDYVIGAAAEFSAATVISVTVEAPEKTYGLTVEDDHSHVTGGVVTHNTGRLSSSDPNCFHPSTEVLTRDGWVSFRKYEKGTPVAQWTPDGTISFVKPTAYVAKFAEKLVYLDNQHIRLRVTEDHRCLLRHRRTGELKVFAGKDYPEDWQQIHAGVHEGGRESLGIPLVQLLVAVQADGFVDRGAIELVFKKQRKIDRAGFLLDQLGIKHSRSEKNKRGVVRFRIPVGADADRILGILGPKKEFGPWLLDLPSAEAAAFCEEVFFWDGSWTRKNSYSSDSENNARWVQTMLALSGKRAHWRVYEKANGDPNYQVDIVHRDYSLTTNVEKKIKRYDGDVYCLSVPSSYLLVRSEGEVHVTGQCQNIPTPERDKWGLRSLFVARPGYDLIVADYNQLEMRLLAAAALEQDMINIFLKGWDIHMGNAEIMYGIPYDELKEAKKIDKAVQEGKMPAEALTQRVIECLTRRSEAKNIGFGLNYGMGAKKLANDLGISVAEAEMKIQHYKNTYKAVSRFYEEVVNLTRKTGYAFTVLGRRRNLPDISSSSNEYRARAERQAVNVEIQGSAADVVKMAQINLDNAQLDRRFGCIQLLNVHDELIFECPKETVKDAKPEIAGWMEMPFVAMDLAVPLTVAIGSGHSWREAK